MLSQTRFSLPYSLAALRFRYDLWKNQIYPSNPYPFADTIGAVPRVSSEPISSRVLHRFGSLLPPSLFHSPASRPPLSSPLAPLLSAPDSTLCRPQSSAYPRPTPSSGKLSNLRGLVHKGALKGELNRQESLESGSLGWGRLSLGVVGKELQAEYPKSISKHW